MKIDNNNISDLVGMIFYDGTISAFIEDAELSNYGSGSNDVLEIHTMCSWISIELGLFGELPEPWAIYRKDDGEYLSCVKL